MNALSSISHVVELLVRICWLAFCFLLAWALVSLFFPFYLAKRLLSIKKAQD